MQWSKVYKNRLDRPLLRLLLDQQQLRAAEYDATVVMLFDQFCSNAPEAGRQMMEINSPRMIEFQKLMYNAACQIGNSAELEQST